MDLPGLQDLALASAEVEFWLARSRADRDPSNVTASVISRSCL